MTDWIAELCHQAGVASAYDGFDGQPIAVSPDVQAAVLHAMGFDVASQGSAKAQVHQNQSDDAQRPLTQEVIVRADQAQKIPVRHPADWTLLAEGSGVEIGRGAGTTDIILPAMPIGIHKLMLTTSNSTSVTWVLARPARSHMLGDEVEQARIWGVLAALYGLTDGDAAALGTYDRLGTYAAALAQRGADFIGINPIHAMGQTRPNDVISPYSPNHRAFLNTWHCWADVGTRDDLVDYGTALPANTAILARQFAAWDGLPKISPEKRAFSSYVDAAGAPLQDYALFDVLAQTYGADWRAWPHDYQDPRSEAVADFRRSRTREITQLCWAQWVAQTQLADAQSVAQSAGMRVGLYLDLAVGPRLGSAETWGSDTVLVNGATLGAPPDPLGPSGQSWGLAPLSPTKIREDGYASFARLLRALMRHAGMIRIDHVLGLMRSFWIPEGHQSGTYVQYPLDALLAVVAIESVRNQTIVVGEDLGLVPAGLREKLSASGIYGLDVLQYMRTDTGGFADTSTCRKTAVCAFATHDTPTITGFFTAEDVRLRRAFGGLDDATVQDTIADRGRAAQTIDGADKVRDIHTRLARGTSEMVAVQLDDLAARRAQQNLPGTVDEHPNWRLKAPFSVAEIAGSETIAQLGADMAMYGRSNTTGMETGHDLSDSTNRTH